MIAASLDPLGGLAEMLGHEFIRNALLGGTLVAAAAGLVGHFVLLRNQVFTGDALSHVAFTSALAALLAGVDVLAGLVVATIAVGLGMGALGGRARARDVVIGTVFAWMLGLGALLQSIYLSSRSGANGTAGVGVLFGSIYGLSGRQALIVAAVGLGVAASVALIARPLLFASIDPDVAAARGVAVRTLGLGFLALVALTVAVSVQAVGALLVVGLLVTPAATAQRLVARPLAAMWLSAALAVGCVWLGLVIGYAVPRVPPSFAIIAPAFAAYVAVSAGAAVRRRLAA